MKNDLTGNEQPGGARAKCLLCGPVKRDIIKTSPRGDVLLCPKCGAAFRERSFGAPEIMPDERKKDAMDKLSFHLTKSSGHVMRRVLNRAARVKKPPGDMLDVGCGEGRFMRAAKEAGWNAQGLEVARSKVNFCRDMGFEVFEGTLAQMNPVPGSFDAVAMIEVCEVLPDPLAEFRLARRALKPGGVLFFRSLNLTFHLSAHRLYQRFSRIFDALGVGNPSVFHWHCFSPRSFRLFLESAGFEVVEISPSPTHRADPHGQLKKPIARLAASIAIPLMDAAASAIYFLSGKRLVPSTAFIAVCRKSDAPNVAPQAPEPGGFPSS